MPVTTIHRDVEAAVPMLRIFPSTISPEGCRVVTHPTSVTADWYLLSCIGWACGRRGSETAAVAVWVRVLLPQITGGPTAASAPSPAAAPAGVSGSKAAAVPPSAGASAQQQQKQQEQSLLSPASADKAFAYLDELLRSQEVKRGMVTGISVRDGELPLSLVPPSAVVAVAQVIIHTQIA